MLSEKVRYNIDKDSIKTIDLDPFIILIAYDIIPACSSIGLSFHKEEHLTDLVLEQENPDNSDS